MPTIIDTMYSFALFLSWYPGKYDNKDTGYILDCIRGIDTIYDYNLLRKEARGLVKNPKFRGYAILAIPSDCINRVLLYKGYDDNPIDTLFDHSVITCWDRDNRIPSVGLEYANNIYAMQYRKNPGDCLEWLITDIDEGFYKIVEFSSKQGAKRYITRFMSDYHEVIIHRRIKAIDQYR